MTADAVVLVLTWTKTANIRKDALAVQIRVPVTALLLRDGQYLLSCRERSADSLGQRDISLPVSDLDTPATDILTETRAEFCLF